MAIMEALNGTLEIRNILLTYQGVKAYQCVV